VSSAQQCEPGLGAQARWVQVSAHCRFVLLKLRRKVCITGTLCAAVLQHTVLAGDLEAGSNSRKILAVSLRPERFLMINSLDKPGHLTRFRPMLVSVHVKRQSTVICCKAMLVVNNLKPFQLWHCRLARVRLATCLLGGPGWAQQCRLASAVLAIVRRNEIERPTGREKEVLVFRCEGF